MSRQRLLVLFGGSSSEHEVSLRSARCVLDAIDLERFEPLAVGIRRDRGWRTGPAQSALEEIIAHGDALSDLRELSPDIVFPVLHGPNGEDGTIQGALELMGLPYAGANVLASAMCMDKAVQKHMLAACAPEVPLVPWVEVDIRTLTTPQELTAAAERIAEKLGLPCFCKPANLGSSVGVSRCTTREELRAALRDAGRYDHKLVVEQGIDAREIEIAVLGNGGPETILSSPGEIELPKGTWYDYATKYLEEVARYHIPATLPPGVEAQIRAHALTTFRALGCSGLARIDFLLDRNSNIAYLNEPNTMPGFTSISMYPKLMAHAGVGYTKLITRLCELALARFEQRARLEVDR